MKVKDGWHHGLWTPNESINQVNLKIWADVAAKICFGGTGKSLSEGLIFSSINPKYSIPLLGRFTLIIHHISTSRTLVERH